MEFKKVITERYSVRSFDKRTIEKEKLDAILEAARLAPTACNNQPQRIKVLTTAKDLALVDSVSPCRYNAPVAILVCYDKTKAWVSKVDGVMHGEVDASIVLTQMMLQAADLGLGSLWVGMFDPKKTCEVFKLGANIVPVSFLMVGYPAPDSRPAKMHTDRKPLKELLI